MEGSREHVLKNRIFGQRIRRTSPRNVRSRLERHACTYNINFIIFSISTYTVRIRISLRLASITTIGLKSWIDIRTTSCSKFLSLPNIYDIHSIFNSRTRYVFFSHAHDHTHTIERTCNDHSKESNARNALYRLDLPREQRK